VERGQGGVVDSLSPSTGQHLATAVQGARGGVIFALLLIALMLYSVSFLYPIYVHPPASSIQDIQAHERASGELALSSYSEYLPTWTHPDALDPEKLRPYFEQNQPVIRLIPPEGVTLNAADWHGTSATLELTAHNPATLVFDWLFIPGWQARFTNAPSSDLPLSVEPSPEGFVSIEIPAGTHTLAISLEQTLLQQTAWGITFLAFSVWLLLAGMGIRSRLISKHLLSTQHSALSTRILILIIVVAIGAVIFKLLIVDHTPNIWRQERFTPDALNSVQADFNREIALIAVQRPASVESGSETPLTLFWRLSNQKLTNDYSSILELRDSAGVLVANGGSFMPGGLATSNWLPGYYIAESLDFQIPPFTPPGIYTLELGLYNPTTQERLSVINAAGNPEDVKYKLGQIEISFPERTLKPPLNAIGGNNDLGIVPLSNSATKPDVTGIPDHASVGDEMLIRWHWRNTFTSPPDYSARLVWLYEDEIQAASATVPITTGFPTSMWGVSNNWVGHHLLYVPGDLAAGEYQVGVQLLDEVGNPTGEIVMVAPMTVTTPVRTYDLPAIQHDSDAAWQNGILLRGYNVNQSVSTLTLYWQTEQPINQSLRLFVHVLDGETIIAQSDGIPANWTRPTTGWVAGEVITTNHTFDVPLENYQLRIGWYDPRTNQRIPLADGSDSLLIQP
jgi:hypothetical protein